jgi:hypothetical protein
MKCTMKFTAQPDDRKKRPVNSLKVRLKGGDGENLELEFLERTLRFRLQYDLYPQIPRVAAFRL